MLVRYRKTRTEDVTTKEATYFVSKQLHLTFGKEYEVYALSFYDGVAFVLVIDDLDTPTFLPQVVFEMVNPTISASWICNFFPDCAVRLVAGPEFIAKDFESYNAMIDMEYEQVKAFWNYVQEYQLASK
jgi:hypothetical protein